VVLYHDKAHNVYRSPDEGKTWSRVVDVPLEKAYALIMHAFDPKRVRVTFLFAFLFFFFSFLQERVGNGVQGREGEGAWV
jgi:hypothetical protein